MAIKYRSALPELAEQIIDRAMADVLSGDLENAKQSIGRAKNAGAAEDLLTTLEAVALYSDGKRNAAAELIEEAVRKSPFDRLLQAGACKKYCVS